MNSGSGNIHQEPLRPVDKKKDPQTTRALVLIFCIMLIDVMGILMLSPVAPQIMLRFSDKAVMVTMITIIYAGAQFVAAPIIGRLGDRYGRRPVLLLSVLGQALGYLIFGLAGSLWMLLLGRLVGGITAGNLSTANAYIADVSKPEERAKNFTLIGTAWSLGLILGPALGGLFGQISLEAPAFLAAGLALLSVLFGLFLLPESLPVEKRVTTPISLRDLNPIASIFDMGVKPGLGALLLVNALFSLAFNGASSTLPLFVIQKFSAVTSQISLLLILAGISIALTNTFIVPKAIPRFGVKNAGVFSLIGLAVVYTSIFFAPRLWMLYPLNMTASMMNSFVFPALITLSTEMVDPHEIGLLMGVNSSVGSLANVFGPLYAGIVYDHVMRGAPHWMGAFILLAAAWMFMRVPTRPHHTAVHSSQQGISPERL